jgi:hypothetical protein
MSRRRGRVGSVAIEFWDLSRPFRGQVEEGFVED